MPAVPELAAERMAVVSGHPRSQFNAEWMVEEVTDYQDERGYWQSVTAVTPKASGAGVPKLIQRNSG